MPTQKTGQPSHLESLEEFLADEVPSTACLFTITSLPDQPAKVRLTPAMAGAGCLCEWSLVIDKTQISGVQRHAQKTCCGENKEVVRVVFKDEASITLSDIFGQLQDNIRRRRDKPVDKHLIPVIQPIAAPPNHYSGGNPSADADATACVYVASKLYHKAVARCELLPVNERAACLGLALYNYGEMYTSCNVPS